MWSEEIAWKKYTPILWRGNYVPLLAHAPTTECRHFFCKYQHFCCKFFSNFSTEKIMLCWLHLHFKQDNTFHFLTIHLWRQTYAQVGLHDVRFNVFFYKKIRIIIIVLVTGSVLHRGFSQGRWWRHQSDQRRTAKCLLKCHLRIQLLHFKLIWKTMFSLVGNVRSKEVQGENIVKLTVTRVYL